MIIIIIITSVFQELLLHSDNNIVDDWKGFLFTNVITCKNYKRLNNK